jgi:hypothetical protein
MTLLYRGRHAAKANRDPAPADEPIQFFEDAEPIDTSVTTTPTSAVRGSEHNPNVSHPVRDR